ncbi:hypothetical protein F751_6212 [Auxenochlorella protothecoides]|uniref:Uncharacterized protein n=1 Tax=Auxenochlorella protothecoides TaxID=3075 RepID=A0A087SK07_AUXPR|nr:hypothetical protein F751_6212 [Auxenochlorella protothecoides]KFM26061.1 hypothetical protein F751_6212 [Auxenochlorella protothecoides]
MYMQGLTTPWWQKCKPNGAWSSGREYGGSSCFPRYVATPFIPNTDNRYGSVIAWRSGRVSI